MSWTAPRTWVTGEYLSAALMNEQVRDNLLNVRLGYGTSLPGSPSDGDGYVLVDSTTVPTYQWQLRYNGGSNSAYKWEFIGGAPMVAEIAVSESLTYGYANLGTLGPQLTLPRNGDYDITAMCFASSNGDNGNARSSYMSYDIGATGASDAWAATVLGGWSAWAGASAIRTYRHTGRVAAEAVVAKYKHDQNGTSNAGSFSNRRLQIVPVRLA